MMVVKKKLTVSLVDDGVWYCNDYEDYTVKKISMVVENLLNQRIHELKTFCLVGA